MKWHSIYTFSKIALFGSAVAEQQLARQWDASPFQIPVRQAWVMSETLSYITRIKEWWRWFLRLVVVISLLYKCMGVDIKNIVQPNQFLKTCGRPAPSQEVPSGHQHVEDSGQPALRIPGRLSQAMHSSILQFALNQGIRWNQTWHPWGILYMKANTTVLQPNGSECHPKLLYIFKNVDRIEIPLHKQNMHVWSSHAVLHGEMQFHYQRMAALQPPVHRLDGGCTLIVAWPNIELGRIEAGIHWTTPWHWWKQQIYRQVSCDFMTFLKKSGVFQKDHSGAVFFT